MTKPRIHSHSWTVRLTAANTSRDTLLYIQNISGVGNVHLTAKEHDNTNTLWRWTCSRTATLSVVQQIKPFLRLKARHADILLEVGRIIDREGGKSALIEPLYNEIKVLNYRGVRRGSEAGIAVGPSNA